MMQPLFQFGSMLLTIYSMLIVVRIILTWFQGVSYGRAYEMLTQITDPYLNWFRENVPIRVGALDFSALAAIVALGLVNSVFSQLAVTGTITVAFVLQIIVSSAFSIVSFFMTFFLVIAVVRLVGLITGWDERGRIWSSVERFLNPVMQIAVRPLLRGRFTGYRESLMIFGGEMLAGVIAVRIGGALLMALLSLIPF